MNIFTIFAVVLLVSNISAANLNTNIIQPDIIGGSEAARNQFPYQVAVFTNPAGWICGGSLISTTTVITAGHCIYQPPGTVNVSTDIEYGVLKIFNTTDEPDRVFQVASGTLVHPSYNPSTLANDLALVFAAAITVNSAIAPIALPTSSSLTFSNTNAVMSGWGYISQSSGVSPNLKYVNTITISQLSCSFYYGPIRNTNICTEGVVGGTNVGGCYGDSGGPLAALKNNVLTLIGVLSFIGGTDCAAGFPTGFTRTTSFLSWIISNMT